MNQRPDFNPYGSRTSMMSCVALAVVSLAIGILSVGAGWAYEPKLDTDAPLKPLVDTYKPSEEKPEATKKSLDGHVEREGIVPVNESPAAEKKPLVLTGKVQTLQQAIESERATVDWYGWYLSARDYLWRTGGLRCALGTPIKFYRDGRIEAMTFDTACISSVLGKRFPLPKNTELDALILPVRPGQGPPASPQEIYSRIRS